jgi:hypothetical protein
MIKLIYKTIIKNNKIMTKAINNNHSLIQPTVFSAIFYGAVELASKIAGLALPIFPIIGLFTLTDICFTGKAIYQNHQITKLKNKEKGSKNDLDACPLPPKSETKPIEKIILAKKDFKKLSTEAKLTKLQEILVSDDNDNFYFNEQINELPFEETKSSDGKKLYRISKDLLLDYLLLEKIKQKALVFDEDNVYFNQKPIGFKSEEIALENGTKVYGITKENIVNALLNLKTLKALIKNGVPKTTKHKI